MKAIVNAYYWCLNRFVEQTHLVKLRRLHKGTHYDTDERMLHAMFGLLEDYMLYEIGAEEFDFRNTFDSNLPHNNAKRWWKSLSRLERIRLFLFRRRFVYDRFIADHTDWLREFDEFGPVQHHVDGNILAHNLYLWWTVDRPKRLAGIDMVSKEAFEAQQHNNDYALWSVVDELDKQLEDTDTENLKKLISIRHYLWT
jgi:hypothetical protein